jgi:DNA-directed RNA polymerase specialized sigma24 family protein
MGPDLQSRTSSPSRRRASAHLHIPGLKGSGQVLRVETERTRNRRKAVLRRRLFRNAAGALGGYSEDAIQCSWTPPPPQLWHPGTMRRDLARHASLVELCVARGCPLEDAKELVQEAHLRLFIYQRSTMVRDAESLLRRIVINLAINYYHRVLSRCLVFETIDEVEKQGIVVDPTPGPERTLAAEQQLDTVVSLMSAMSRRTCQIFIAQRTGYSYEEVAAAFAIKPRTVEKHVALATSTLVELLQARLRQGSPRRGDPRCSCA